MKDKGFGTELNLFNIPTMSGNYYKSRVVPWEEL